MQTEAKHAAPAPSMATRLFTRRRTAAVGIAAVVIASVATTAHANRSNPYGFSRATTSSVDYTSTPYAAAAECTSLTALASNGITMTAEVIASDGNTPAHCRIKGTIPAEVGFEVNLPLQWNGRLFMFGNGGFAGESADSAGEAESRVAGLRAGFLTARTDTGHLSSREPLGTFAYQQVNKVEDHGYRAVHETVVLAKLLANAFYARAPKYSYWQGCSTGGRQGMMAASRYPEDFDGIAAAAPTLRWSDVMMKGLSNQQALDTAPTLTHAKLGNVFKAVLAKCDARDGVVDGLLADPRNCDFDATRDLPRCTGAVDDNCFTEAETAALAKIRNGPVIKGQSYFPQYPGMEEASTARTWIRNPDGSPNTLAVFAETYMKYLAFLPQQDPNYDWRSFSFASDPDRMAVINDLWNPKPTLEAFKARNGKILTYWGLADAALNPVMGTDYYGEIVRRMGGVEQVQAFYRMYMIPGVAHCSGGYGPDQIDAMTPLIEWVEAGKAPERLLAQKTVDGALKYNRSFCPFPQATVYRSGDPERPESYQCVTPASLNDPAPVADHAGGGGCTVSANARDASLPVLVAFAAAGLAYRRKRHQQG